MTLRVRHEQHHLARALRLVAGAALAVALAFCAQFLLARRASAAPVPAPLVGIGPVQVGPVTVEVPVVGTLIGPDAGASPAPTGHTATLPSASVLGLATVGATTVDAAPVAPGTTPAIEVGLPTVEVAGATVVAPPAVSIPSVSLPSVPLLSDLRPDPSPPATTPAAASPTTTPDIGTSPVAGASVPQAPTALPGGQTSSSSTPSGSVATEATPSATSGTALGPAGSDVASLCCSTHQAHEAHAVDAGPLADPGATQVQVGAGTGSAPTPEVTTAAGAFAVLAADTAPGSRQPPGWVAFAHATGSMGHPGLPPTSPD